MADGAGKRSFWRALSDRWRGSPLPMRTAVTSVCGQRAENQDNYLLLADGQARLMRDGEPVSRALPKWPQHRLRVAVFDGMGGHSDGRQVAEAAAEAAACIRPQNTAADTRAAVLELHRQLATQFGDPAARSAGRHTAQRNPGTTMVWAELDQRTGRGWLATVGDSRVYRCSSNGQQQLTNDHTLAEFNWRDGDLDEAEYRRLSASGGQRLAQALGYGSWGIRYDDRGLKPFLHHPELRLDLACELSADRQTHADIRPLQLLKGERLLLASDGLWDTPASDPWMGPDASVDVALRAEELAQSALRRGSSDNVTVLLVEGN